MLSLFALSIQYVMLREQRQNTTTYYRDYKNSDDDCHDNATRAQYPHLP